MDEQRMREIVAEELRRDRWVEAAVSVKRNDRTALGSKEVAVLRAIDRIMAEVEREQREAAMRHSETLAECDRCATQLREALRERDDYATRWQAEARQPAVVADVPVERIVKELCGLAWYMGGGQFSELSRHPRIALCAEKIKSLFAVPVKEPEPASGVNEANIRAALVRAFRSINANSPEARDLEAGCTQSWGYRLAERLVPSLGELCAGCVQAEAVTHQPPTLSREAVLELIAQYEEAINCYGNASIIRGSASAEGFARDYVEKVSARAGKMAAAICDMAVPPPEPSDLDLVRRALEEDERLKLFADGRWRVFKDWDRERAGDETAGGNALTSLIAWARARLAEQEQDRPEPDPLASVVAGDGVEQ